ncbi:hypothetical protein CASFOL_023251 [Castilleja foliolosa]|uniref:Knottins-like domain-containing protein n=1 Tax=Castilleja foliolosa TaxID=1961234 RepID=A0ABD3CL08_9LAMI
MENKAFGVLFLLLIIFLFSQGMMPQAEAKMCKLRSKYYKGHCFNDTRCAIVCRYSGFSGGNCKGQHHKHCFCTKLC